MGLAVVAMLTLSCSGLENPATFEDGPSEIAPAAAYAIGAVPDGYELCGVSVPSGLSLRPEESPSLFVYGDGDRADPYDGPLIGVASFDAVGLDDLPLGPVEEVRVQGAQAMLGTIAGFQLADLDGALGTTLTWSVGAGRIVQLVARGTDIDLVELAAAVRVEEGRGRLDPTALPGGFVDLGDLYVIEGRPQFRFSLDYQRLDAGSEDALTLLGSEGGVEALNAFRFRASSSARLAIGEVTGVAADIGPGGSGPWVVVWPAGDRLLLRLFSFRLEPATLVEVAETVAVIEGDAWASALRDHDPPSCGR